MFEKISLYLVVTNVSSSSTKFPNIETALCKYHHQLSLKSIIIPFVSIYFSNSFLNSLDVSSQNIFIAIYHIFPSFNSLESTDGIFIFCLITSIFNILFSHGLIISNITFVRAFPLIKSTASYKSNHSNS